MFLLVKHCDLVPIRGKDEKREEEEGGSGEEEAERSTLLLTPLRHGRQGAQRVSSDSRWERRPLPLVLRDWRYQNAPSCEALSARPSSYAKKTSLSYTNCTAAGEPPFPPVLTPCSSLRSEPGTTMATTQRAPRQVPLS